MKKNLLYVASLSMIILFTACGGGGDSTVVAGASTSAEETSDDLMTTTNMNNDISMKIDEVYTMNKGDLIIKVSTAPIVELDTNITTGKTTATLVEGKAKIKKGSRIPTF